MQQQVETLFHDMVNPRRDLPPSSAFKQLITKLKDEPNAWEYIKNKKASDFKITFTRQPGTYQGAHNLLHFAALYGDVDDVQVVLKNGFAINAHAEDVGTPLILAVS